MDHGIELSDAIEVIRQQLSDAAARGAAKRSSSRSGR